MSECVGRVATWDEGRGTYSCDVCGGRDFGTDVIGVPGFGYLMPAHDEPTDWTEYDSDNDRFGSQETYYE